MKIFLQAMSKSLEINDDDASKVMRVNNRYRVSLALGLIKCDSNTKYTHTEIQMEKEQTY